MKVFLAAFTLSLTLVGLTPPGRTAEHSFVGSKRCKPCHLQQHKSWEQTKMANAFVLLKAGERAEAKKKAGLDPKKDYTTDKTCLPCHVTGYGKPGGFKSIEEAPDLAGVGCEMCHGAGGDYIKTGLMTLQNKEYKRTDLVAAGLNVPKAETCTTQCHNTKSPFVGKNYVFDWTTRKAQGTHTHFPLKYKHE